MSGKGDFRKRMDRLNRYLPVSCSSEEERIIDDWLNARLENSSSAPEPDAQSLQRIKSELRERINQQITVSETTKRRSWLGVAASVVFCLFVGLGSYLWMREGSEKLLTIQNTGFTTQRTVLPDGSVIWLNAATKIRVPQTLKGGQRTVYLDEGEAYFDVARDEKRPFFVHTSTLTVQVLGTVFNIKSYRCLDEVRVAVTEGMICVAKGKHELEKLSKDRELIFNKKADRYGVRKVESQALSRWRDGEIHLIDAPLPDLFLAIEHKYHVAVSYQDGQLGSERISMQILPDQELEEVMDALVKIFNIQYQKIGKEVVIHTLR